MDNTEDIGVITGIDGKTIENVSSEDREEWANSLCKKLESVEGLEDVFIDSMNPTFSTVTIAAEVTNTQTHSGYELDVNLRSVGQNIRNTLDSDKYASVNIVENTIESPSKIQDNTYDTCFYFITISYP